MTCWDIIPLIFTATRRLLSHLNEENETQREREGHLPKVSQLGGDRARIGSLSSLAPKPKLSDPHSNPPHEHSREDNPAQSLCATLALVLSLKEARLT